MTPELKPCPFCGRKKALRMTDFEFGGAGFVLVCDFNKGGCGGSAGSGDTEGEAIKAWNRRANDT